MNNSKENLGIYKQVKSNIKNYSLVLWLLLWWLQSCKDPSPINSQYENNISTKSTISNSDTISWKEIKIKGSQFIQNDTSQNDYYEKSFSIYKIEEVPDEIADLIENFMIKWSGKLESISPDGKTVIILNERGIVKVWEYEVSHKDSLLK